MKIWAMMVLKVGTILAISIAVIFYLRSQSGKTSGDDVADHAAVSSQTGIATSGTVVGSISGAAWLNLNNGESLLQRGLRIQLLRTQVSSEPVLVISREAIREQVKSADKYNKLASDEVDLATKTTNDIQMLQADVATNGDKIDQLVALLKDTQNQIAINTEATKDCFAKYTRLHDFLQLAPTPATIRVPEAYELTKAAASGPDIPFDTVASACQVVEVNTDVDGKFSLTNIPVGDYFLRSELNTSALFVEWLVPVHVDGSQQKINLDNENTATLSTRN